MNAHSIDVALWGWAQNEVNSFILLENVFPEEMEVKVFVENRLLPLLPKKGQYSDLLTKVCTIEILLVYLGCVSGINIFLQFRREVSQTRTKAKDACLTYLHKIVPDITIPAGPISDAGTKAARVQALQHLVKPKEIYLYRPAIYKDGQRFCGPHDPYCSPYIRNTIRILF